MYDETDVITLSNLEWVATVTATQRNPVWAMIRERYPEIRGHIDSLPRTLTYNDFYWTNLVVARDRSEAMMLDLHLLGKGIAYADVRNATSSLGDTAAGVFRDEYGAYSADEEMADAVLAPLSTLVAACERDDLPMWARSSLDELVSGRIYTSLGRWLDA